MQKIPSFIFFLLLVFSAKGEQNISRKDSTEKSNRKYTFSNKIADINIGYNYQIPSADLLNRFGNFNSIYIRAYS
jgi:hypothetical protein